MRIIRRSRWIVFVLLITLTACSGVRLFQNSGTKSKGKTMDSSAGPLASKRAFEFQYVANVSVDGNHEPTVHIPVPEDSPWQTIRSIDFEAPVEPDIYHDRDYGNKIARFELESSDDTQTVRMTFRVKRKQRKLQVPGTISTRSFENSPYYSRFTTHHPYMETNSRIKNMAQKIKGKSETYMAQARNLYDRIRKMMSYDKSGKGWGRGDISYCLNVGKGNCTDFHTFYDSVAREMGMPAEFLMGFPIPRTKHSGSVGGYHCWTQVYVPNRGWMPMDISEADKHSDLVDYYYGTLDADRVTMTMGKNIRLSSGKRVNYLVYPEVNDEDRTTVSYSFSFTNIPL